MDNKAKVYTLYFVFEDLLISINNLVKNGENSRENVDNNKLFNEFLTQAQEQYSDLNYDFVCEMSFAYDRAARELGRIASRIETFLGKVENGSNFSLVLTLWMALNLALCFYASICEDQPNLVYDLEEQLRLGHQKYLSTSQSNSKGWQHTDSIIKSKLGNF